MACPVDLMLILLTHIQIEKERIRDKQQKKLKALGDYGILIYYFMCAFVWGHVGIKKPEVNVRCLHKLCSTLFFEAGFPHRTWSLPTSWAGWPEPMLLPPKQTTPIFTWVLRSEHRYSHFWTKCLPDQVIFPSRWWLFLLPW